MTMHHEDDVAHYCLLDALTCAFQSLQQPACTRLLGPVVPGATMTFGARVPGTSFQLDPVQAAFNLGTMIGWLGQQDAAFATHHGHLADTLPAVLSVADYQARKALAEGRTPATVRDVLDAMLNAAAMNDEQLRATAASVDRCDSARIASATATASILGASATQIAHARRLAAAESRVDSSMATPPAWWLGEANARGVRIALLVNAASATQPDSRSPAQTSGTTNLNATDAAIIRERFVAAMTAYFPPTQATKIASACLDRTRLEAMPINELVSLTVRN